MAKVLTSVSGLPISAASAGYSPTNSGDVSAIASGYQVVSATATQLYAGTAYLTSVNDAPVSASRAGNAANASLATSAYYDGTGRLISALPDSAAVSSIASSYAESAASGKLDSTAQVVSATAGDGTYVTSINGMGISGQGGGGAQVVTATGSASAFEGWWPPFTTSYLVSSINGSALLPYGYSALSGKSGNWNSVYSTVNSNSASWGVGASIPITGSAGDVTATYEVEFLSFVRNDTAGEPDIRTASLGTDQLYIDYTLDGIDHTSVSLTESMLDFMDSDGDHIVDAYSIDSWNSAVNTVANNSASWGGGVDSATVSAIASGYAESAVSSKADSSSLSSYALSADVSGCIDTVSANSATWGGGATGDYVETSATEVAIGYSNSATDTAFAQGRANKASSYSFAQGLSNSASSYSFSQGSVNSVTNTSFAQGQSNSASSCSFAHGSFNSATGTSFAQGSLNKVSSNSFAQGVSNKVSSYSFAQGEYNSASSCSFAHGKFNSAINTAVVFGQYNLRGDGSTSTGNSAAFAIGNGISTAARHDLMLVTKNGEITMYSSTADTTGTGIMSSLRSKADSSALSSYALSADVSGTVDLVSTQSANWGGSALALSAGPGVKLEKVGNTLVASTDETVLWSGAALTPGGSSAALSEDASHFERLKVYAVFNPGAGFTAYPQAFEYNGTHLRGGYLVWGPTDAYSGKYACGGWSITNGTSFKQVYAGQTDTYPTINFHSSYGGVMMVVGINRTAGV